SKIASFRRRTSGPSRLSMERRPVIDRACASLRTYFDLPVSQSERNCGFYAANRRRNRRLCSGLRDEAVNLIDRVSWPCRNQEYLSPVIERTHALVVAKFSTATTA